MNLKVGEVKKSKKQGMEIRRMLPPQDIYVDPKADYLYPRWWHRFVFWKKFRYPEWKIKRRFITLTQLKRIKKL
jgi:hypothetical protein